MATPSNFVTRAQWGSSFNYTNNTRMPSSPLGVALHWEGPKMGTFAHSECDNKVRSIEAFHVKGRGWAGIAYNALICPHGYIYEGRGLRYRNAANGDTTKNGNYFAACYLGGQGDPFTSLAKAAYIRAVQWFRADGNAGSRVIGHRDLTATECPGATIQTWLKATDFSAGTTAPAPDAPVWGQPATWVLGGASADVTRLGQRLVIWAKALGLPAPYFSGPGPTFTDVDKAAVAAFQKAQGWAGADADGYPGLETFRRLALDPAGVQEPVPTPTLTAVWGKPETWKLGATGPDVTRLGERLVIHAKALGLPAPYSVGPGPEFTETDRTAVAAFQRAQGWTGTGADGYPGALTFAKLEETPEAPTQTATVKVISASQNFAGNNARGIATASTRIPRYVAARKASPVHVINAQECTYASTVRTRLDNGLGPLGYKRNNGGKGRYTYTRGVKVIARGLITTPSTTWYQRDDKQAAWVIYELDGAIGMDVSGHLESDSGATADAKRVEQAKYIASKALSIAKANGCPEKNVMLAWDTNSEGMVLAALVKAGWRNCASGTPFVNTHTFMGWDGLSRKRFDYAMVRADAAPAEVVAVSHDTRIADHAGLRIVRQLTK